MYTFTDKWVNPVRASVRLRNSGQVATVETVISTGLPSIKVPSLLY